MDLNQHCKAFQVGNKITTAIKDCDGIVEFFCVKILKIQGFEAEIFEQLFKDVRVILLMDGIDEICPSYKKFKKSIVECFAFFHYLFEMTKFLIF